jgi:hypothetical protein
MQRLFLAAIALVSLLSAARAQDNAVIDRHMAVATKAAKTDLLGALGLCKTATPQEATGFMENYTKMKAEPPARADAGDGRPVLSRQLLDQRLGGEDLQGSRDPRRAR